MLHTVARMVRADAADFRERIHANFYRRLPEAHHIFALNMSGTHSDFVPALAWFFEHCDADGTPPADIVERARTLGRDHRRHGFPPEAYEAFRECIMEALNMFPLDSLHWEAAENAITQVTAALADAARAADAAAIPPAHQAQVMAIAHPNRETAIVRLEVPTDLNISPGQSLPVTSHLLPGTWRWLTPAAPVGPTGQVEFHVALPKGSATQPQGNATQPQGNATAPHGSATQFADMLLKARVGDVWTLGNPSGSFVEPIDGVRDVFLCFGTGWAAVRAHLLDRVQKLQEAGEPVDLEGAVYAVGASPGFLYDTTVQTNLAALCPRLDFYWPVLAADDRWLLGAQPLAPGTDWEVSADPTLTALHREVGDDIAGRAVRFILVGPAHLVLKAEHTLLIAGIDPRDIAPYPWAHRLKWT